MRIAFLGAGKVSMATARRLLELGHEVVVIERNRQKIDSLSEGLDAAFIQGDGSKPSVLKELGPEQVDVLFCLTNTDQDNIIASLVARSLGFPYVVTKIEDFDLEQICAELGLEHTIIPTRTISNYLADMARGVDYLELTTMIKGAARFFSFRAGKGEAVAIEKLELPDMARVICYYRDGAFHLASDGEKLQEGDEVVILTHSKNMKELTERWTPGMEEKKF
jgi:trk system potassium uptake protein TrkA